MLPTKLAFIDIETTGGRTQYDRIIEIGIMRVENDTITKTFSSLINPEVHLPPEITRLTGITEHELNTAPPFREIAKNILEVLEDCLFIAHNVRFDYGFIKTEFKRLNINFRSKHFCTVRFSRLLYPKERHHNLDSIVRRHNLTIEKRHRAFDDAKAIYEFYNLTKQAFSKNLFTQAVSTVLKRPYLPLKLSAQTIDTLPESPGVYIFYGPNPLQLVDHTSSSTSITTVPLYIGKSINIKERVLSHFAGDIHSSLEMKIAQQIESIETITTPGELGALFLESKLIKKMLPIFNKRLRQKRELIALTQETDEHGYHTVTLNTLTKTPLQELSSFLGFYNSRKQAKDHLAQIVKENILCSKLTGLEKTQSACFAHRLNRCKGACVKEESPLLYNIRFIQAFWESKIRPWPFPGTIIIEEPNYLEDKTDYFIADNWCFLGKTTVDDFGSYNTTEEDYVFDLDTYKILKRYILAPKNMKHIKLLSQYREYAPWKKGIYNKKSTPTLEQ